MIRRLRFLCPLAVLCLVVLFIYAIGFQSNAIGSVDGFSETDAAVTYNANSWSGGLAGPALEQDRSSVALLDEEDFEVTDPVGSVSGDDRFVDLHSDTVPIQAYRDSGYELTDRERKVVERIVMCEAGGEGERGQRMVAQRILEGILRYDYTIEQYIRNYKVMLTAYSNVTDEVRNSVSRVFDNGERVTEEKADLWYNPALTPSSWHEQQVYVTTIGSHRFFWMIDDDDV